MKQVSATSTSFTAEFPYDQTLVEIVKSIPGRRWDKENKLWTFPLNLKVAEMLFEILGARGFGFTLEYTEAGKKLKGNLEASRAITSTREFPRPEGLAYRPFQRAGIAFMLGKKAVLNADPPGTGKTVQTIGLINADPSIKNILVVCKAVGKINWQREMEKWLIRPMKIGIAWGSEWPDGMDVVILNFDLLTRFREQLRARTWDLMVLDECQKIKSSKADRTKEVYGVWNKVQDKRIARIPSRQTAWLTGSPSLNGRPIEMWPMLKDAGVFTDWEQYVVRYCNGHKVSAGNKWVREDGRFVYAGENMVWDVSGASNMEELQSILRSSFMIRRKKSEVLPELPPVQRQVVELPARGLRRLINEETQAYDKHLDTLSDLRLAIEKAKVSESDADYHAAIKALRAGVMVALQEVSTKRHEVAMAMLPMAIEFIQDVMENEEKLIVFGHHHDVIDGIAEAFPGCVKVRGGSSKRQEAIDRFQADPEVKMFVGSIGAAGDTITLHASAHIIFVEDSWVPEDINQAEGRASRMGQLRGVYAQTLVLEGSLGAIMAKRRVAKQEIIDATLDDPITLGAIPVLPIEEPTTGNVSRQRITAESLGLTQEEITRIHGELRYLASRCDGARTRDEMGFSGCDSAFGKWLAAADRLSPKMAAAAKRMLVKYKGQLRKE
jgi:SWI/SNF-related matrix-associated actin-dependent regulator 1 of chromatin subfamily A